MSAVIEGVIEKLECALERQRDLLEQLKALEHDFDSELQARLADLRTQLNPISDPLPGSPENVFRTIRAVINGASQVRGAP